MASRWPAGIDNKCWYDNDPLRIAAQRDHQQAFHVASSDCEAHLMQQLEFVYARKSQVKMR